MAITLVQRATNHANTVSSLTVTLGSNTGSGNCLVIYVTTTTTSTVQTVSNIKLGGSADNMALAKRSSGGSITSAEIWTDQNAASGQTSVVITATGSAYITAVVEEWSGIASSSAVDKTNGQSNTAGTSSWSSLASGTLSQANELVVGVVGSYTGSSPATITGPSSPWSDTAQLTTTFSSSITGNQVVSATTTQTFSGTFSATSGYSAVIVTLEAGVQTITGSATFTGAGVFTPTSTPPATATFTGAGTFTPVGGFIQVATMTMTGAGSVAATPTRLLKTLIVSIASYAGTDAHGNQFVQGIGVYGYGKLVSPEIDVISNAGGLFVYRSGT